MVAQRNPRVLRTIPFLIATCHCERSAAIRFRVCVATAVFLLAIVSTTTAKYSGGGGTAQDPYQVATAADLIALGETPDDYGKHFIMTADIDLDPKLPDRKVFDKAVIAPGSADAEGGFQGTAFTGVFDGRGRTISHLTIKGNSYLGLFGQLGTWPLVGEVRGLGLVDVNIAGSGDFVGGLVGSNWSTVTQCYSTGAVTGTGWYVGGLAGYIHDGVTKDCYSTANTTGQDYVGGLVGYRMTGRIINCYAVGRVVGDQSVAGLLGMSVGGTSGDPVTGCFWDIETSGQKTTIPWGGTGRTTAEMQTAKTFLDVPGCRLGLRGRDGQRDGGHLVDSRREGLSALVVGSREEMKPEPIVSRKGAKLAKNKREIRSTRSF